jgi:hypothetical protein
MPNVYSIPVVNNCSLLSWYRNRLVFTKGLNNRYVHLAQQATASQVWAQGLVAEALHLEQLCYAHAVRCLVPYHQFMAWLVQNRQLWNYYNMAFLNRKRAEELHRRAYSLLTEADALLRSSIPSFLQPHPEVDRADTLNQYSEPSFLQPHPEVDRLVKDSAEKYIRDLEDAKFPLNIV